MRAPLPLAQAPAAPPTRATRRHQVRGRNDPARPSAQDRPASARARNHLVPSAGAGHVLGRSPVRRRRAPAGSAPGRPSAGRRRGGVAWRAGRDGRITGAELMRFTRFPPIGRRRRMDGCARGGAEAGRAPVQLS